MSDLMSYRVIVVNKSGLNARRVSEDSYHILPPNIRTYIFITDCKKQT